MAILCGLTTDERKLFLLGVSSRRSGSGGFSCGIFFLSQAGNHNVVAIVAECHAVDLLEVLDVDRVASLQLGNINDDAFGKILGQATYLKGETLDFDGATFGLYAVGFTDNVDRNFGGHFLGLFDCEEVHVDKAVSDGVALDLLDDGELSGATILIKADKGQAASDSFVEAAELGALNRDVASATMAVNYGRDFTVIACAAGRAATGLGALGYFDGNLLVHIRLPAFNDGSYRWKSVHLENFSSRLASKSFQEVENGVLLARANGAPLRG